MNRKIWTTRRHQSDRTTATAGPLTLTTDTLHSLHDTDLARVIGGTTRRTTFARKALAAALAGSVMSLFAGSGAAMADPSHWETFHFEGGDTYADFCSATGPSVTYSFEGDGRSRTTAHGADGLPYLVEFSTHYQTFTNAATGEYVTTVADVREAYQKVTDNGDGTFTVLVADQRNWVLLNQDGERLGRRAGLWEFEILVDNGGTPTDPSDDQVLEDLGTIKDVGKAFIFYPAIVQAIC